jgi:hypothetical protein
MTATTTGRPGRRHDPENARQVVRTAAEERDTPQFPRTQGSNRSMGAEHPWVHPEDPSARLNSGTSRRLLWHSGSSGGITNGFACSTISRWMMQRGYVWLGYSSHGRNALNSARRVRILPTVRHPESKSLSGRRCKLACIRVHCKLTWRRGRRSDHRGERTQARCE